MSVGAEEGDLAIFEVYHPIRPYEIYFWAGPGMLGGWRPVGGKTFRTIEEAQAYIKGREKAL